MSYTEADYEEFVKETVDHKIQNLTWLNFIDAINEAMDAPGEAFLQAYKKGEGVQEALDAVVRGYYDTAVRNFISFDEWKNKQKDYELRSNRINRAAVGISPEID